jgi:hypothetical protein
MSAKMRDDAAKFFGGFGDEPGMDVFGVFGYERFDLGLQDG